MCVGKRRILFSIVKILWKAPEDKTIRTTKEINLYEIGNRIAFKVFRILFVQDSFRYRGMLNNTSLQSY